MVSGEEGVDLAEEVGTGGAAGEEVTDLREEEALNGIVVVDEREDVEVDVVFGDGAGDLVFAIDRLGAGAGDYGISAIVDGVSGERSVGSNDVEPLRKEEVNLADVLAKGGVTGGVVFDIVGGAQAFARVEGDIGGFEVSAAMGGAAKLLVFKLTIGEGAVVALLLGEKKLGQRLHANEADDEDGADNEADEGKYVEKEAEPLPALSLRVVEDLSGHGRGVALACTGSMLCREMPRVNELWGGRYNTQYDAFA